MDSENDVNKMCRLCLAKDQVDVHIFKEKQIFLKISTCLPVKISCDDTFPKKICLDCSGQLDAMYQFWNKSINSESQLLTWLENLSTDNGLSSINLHSEVHVKEETIDFLKTESDIKTEVMEESYNNESYNQRLNEFPDQESSHTKRKRDDSLRCRLNSNDDSLVQEKESKNLEMDRWRSLSEETINQEANIGVPKNTVKTKKYIWKQFMAFCFQRNYVICENTTPNKLSSILKDWAFNMRKSNGEEYKESVVKTFFNVISKILQEKFLAEYNVIINPFLDLVFKEARDARDAKRKQLKKNSDKCKESATAFTPQELEALQKCWDENTPEGLQKKFFIIAATELAWRGSAGAYAQLMYFKKEDNLGLSTDRIEYNPNFAKTIEGDFQRCTESKWLEQNLIDPDVCPVRLFNKLIEKRPKHITTQRLFLTCNRNWGPAQPWYKNMPIGINQITKWTKQTAKKINLDITSRKITSHSHRATANTNFASSAVPKQFLKIASRSSLRTIQSHLCITPDYHQQNFYQLQNNGSSTATSNLNKTVENATIIINKAVLPLD